MKFLEDEAVGDEVRYVAGGGDAGEVAAATAARDETTLKN